MLGKVGSRTHASFSSRNSRIFQMRRRRRSVPSIERGRHQKAVGASPRVVRPPGLRHAILSMAPARECKSSCWAKLGPPGLEHSRPSYCRERSAATRCARPDGGEQVAPGSGCAVRLRAPVRLTIPACKQGFGAGCPMDRRSPALAIQPGSGLRLNASPCRHRWGISSSALVRLDAA